MVQFETGGRIGMALRVECCIRVRDCADTTLSVCFSYDLPGHPYEIFMNRWGLSEHEFATLSLTVGRGSVRRITGMWRATAILLKFQIPDRRNVLMLDIIFLAATALFVGAGILYVRGCERLR